MSYPELRLIPGQARHPRSNRDHPLMISKRPWLAGLKLKPKTIAALRAAFSGMPGISPPRKGNVIAKVAKGAMRVGKAGRVLSKAGKVAGPVGVLIAGFDGINTQRNMDAGRSDLSQTDADARATLRGGGAEIGAWGAP